MTHRADHDAAGTDDYAPPPSARGGAPGKSTLTSRLWRSARRDDRGVAPGAEEAVAGLGGGGAPLPAGVRDRFEASLGADLGAVRVHTDDASATAADAVGARAFARGNDIHFAAGQYQPDDPFGMHLLAHEVAHTVQQSGGAATTQHKLAVSSPGDAAEDEADRAADAMVKGAAASVGDSGAAALHRSPTINKDLPKVAPGGKVDFEKVITEGHLGCFKGAVKVIGELNLKPIDKPDHKVTAQLKSGDPGLSIETEQEVKKHFIVDLTIAKKDSMDLSLKKGKVGSTATVKTKAGPFELKLEAGFDIMKWEAGKVPQFGIASLAGGFEVPLKELTFSGKKFKVTGGVKLKGELNPDTELVAKWLAEAVGARIATMGIGSVGFLAGAILIPVGAFVGGLIAWGKAGHELDEGERWIQKTTGYTRAYVNVLKGLDPMHNIDAGLTGSIAAIQGAKDGKKQLEDHAAKLGIPTVAVPEHLPPGNAIYAAVWDPAWKDIKPAWLAHPKVKGDKVLERTVEAFGTGPYSRWHG